MNAFGLVESVILMGALMPSDAVIWRRIRAAVSGQVINAYRANDFVLAFLYRATAAQKGITGLQAVAGVGGIENYNLTDVISSHDTYRLLVGIILRRVGVEDVDGRAVARQAIIRKNLRSKVKQSTENSPNNHLLAKEDGTGQILMADDRRTPFRPVTWSARSR
nr:putative membrane protein c6f6.13c [Quercus suber]